MSKSDQRRPVRLTSDDAVWITVLDQQFATVIEGANPLDVELAPGLYEARFQAGASIRERYLSLQPGSDTFTVHQPQIAFASPAPLTHTRADVPEQSEAAARLSHAVHRTLGQGGRLMVFVRDNDLRARSSPAYGLTLHRAGEQYGDIDLDGESGGGSEHAHPPWSACTYELTPGLWQLRCPAPGGSSVEQTIAVCENWQTQVFLERARSHAGRTRRPDLADAGVMMAPIGGGFEPALTELRAAELARQGLRDRRLAIPERELNAMLLGKRTNPMLGIYGAHLMTLHDNPDRARVKRVTNNLRKLVCGHPDVRALELWLDEDADVGDFAQPPMLKSSWQIIVAATAKRPELVPHGSFSASISQQLLAAGPWLRWRVATASRPVSTEPGDSLDLGEALASVATALPEDPHEIIEHTEETSAVESGIISYARHASGISDTDVVTGLGVPRTVAEDAVRSVLDRLEG